MYMWSTGRKGRIWKYRGTDSEANPSRHPQLAMNSYAFQVAEICCRLALSCCICASMGLYLRGWFVNLGDTAV